MAPSIHYRGVRGFLALAFGTTLERLRDLPGVTQICAVVTGTVGALMDVRVFLLMLLVLACTQWLDWWLAVKRAGPKYSPQIASNGRTAKLGGLALLLCVRVMEGLVAWALPTLDTHGAIATAAVLALWRSEAQSAEAHMVALGGRGVPVLSRVLSAFGALEALLMPKLPTPPSTPTPAVEERP